MRTAALTVAILLAIPASARGQLSPGPLARPHRALEGTRNCLTCHGTKREAMDGACLACHREVAWLRDQGRGLHAGSTTQRCATCHPDHGGEEFDLVAWNADSARRFDHARARWPLDGAHRDVRCADCHTAEFRGGPVLRLLPAGNDGPAWLGLEQQCSSCHADVHRKTVSSECTSCHTTAKWIPAARFDHDSTDYPLTGRHRDARCASCHVPRREPAPRSEGTLDPVFRPLAAQECSSCHQDVHGGRLGARCSSCHVTAGFGELRPGSFDHTRTRYPLEGRHGRVACEACHGPASERPRPAFAAVTQPYS